MALAEPFFCLIRPTPLAPKQWKAFDYLFFVDDGTIIAIHYKGQDRRWIHCFEDASGEGEWKEVKPALVSKLLKTCKQVSRNAEIKGVRTEGVLVQKITVRA